MNALHKKLMAQSPAYKAWHAKPIHQPVHWIAFVAFTAICAAFVSHNINNLNRLLGTPPFSEASAYACDYYASPTGTATADGVASPWDLQTALSKGAALSNKTLCLRDGVYYGKFVSNLVGATVRSAPNEWAKIDGFASTTLTSSMSAVNNNPDQGGSGPAQAITVADASKITAGSAINIHEQGVAEASEEQVFVNTKSGNTLNVIRGWNGTLIQTHAPGGVVISGGNMLDVAASGSDSTYRNFEITNSDPTRSWGAHPDSQASPHNRGECVFHRGPRTNLINLVLHDCQEGIFSSPSAINSITYGNIIYNNGYRQNVGLSGNQFGGHGWYIQNNEGSTKRYEENFTFNNSVNGAQEESVSGNTVNISNVGNVVVNNTFLIGANGADIGAHADNVTTTDSFFYSNKALGNLRIGYGADDLRRMTITNNYIGIRNDIDSNTNPYDLDLHKSVTTTVTGNTFVVASGWAGLVSAAPGTAYTFNNNRYYDQSRQDATCSGGLSRKGFGYGISAGACGGNLKYSNAYPSVSGATEWREKSGFDAAGPDLGLVAPTTQAAFYSQTKAPNKVFVRPNIYEPGRANVIVYNWSQANSADVNLATAGLADGQSYEIRSVFNYFGAPVASGTYSASSPTATVSMRATDNPIAQPVGSDLPARTTTFPEFGAFVVIPLSNVAAPVIPAISSFSASPTSIAPGGSATLSWNVTNATTLSIDQGVGSVTGNSQTVSPVATTTYTLTATNSAGSATAQTTVTVIPVPPTGNAHLGISPASLAFTGVSGGATPSAKVTTLSNTGTATSAWTATTNQTWCHVSPASGNIAAGASAALSVSVDSPSNVGSFTCAVTVVDSTADNSPQTVTATYSVTAAPTAPTITTFSAAPSTITAGGSSALSWSVTGATTLSIDQGIGIVTGTSRNVSPASTTAYTLTATNSVGSVTKQVTVTVTPAAPTAPTISSFSTSPLSITAGGSATLSWVTTNATTLSINQGVGTVTGNSKVVSPTTTTAYTLTATNSAGSVTAQTTVTVAPTTGGVPVHLNVSPATLNFTAAVGQAAPAPQTFTIMNSGTQTSSWSAGGYSSPCSVSRTSDSLAPGASVSVQVSVDGPSNLGVGTYTCTVSIRDSRADNSPQTVNVIYTVTGSGGTATAPTIGTISVTGKTQTTATIGWKTNIATTGVVQFGTSSGNLSQTVADTNSGTTHTVNLSGLTANKRYYYKITATSDTGASASTGVRSFWTLQ